MKTPANRICADAVIGHLSKGIPPQTTIYECKDVRKFLTVRNVTGGAVKGGMYLGKAVRWYYAEGEFGAINYAKNGNRVAKSEGARPMMDLLDHVPTDLDYAWYIRESYAMLSELGLR